MKRTLLTVMAFMLITCAAFAQTSSVKGVIADLSSNAKLKNATVSLLNAKDSTLYKFTRAAQDGNFGFQNLKNGNFILLVTYPEYADFVNKFSIDATNNTVDFKVIDMKTKAKLLNEVIIKGQAAAIKIKGDTTEFNASAYKIQPNDRVEDLLKKFPGVTVDAQGKITAQGKTVEKVLVDGEEFFGDDPTLVTKNLRADMVDKVQLFEKASDQAAFTGVDDGQKKQTLNIMLKEDKKQGYFGKVDVGYGTDDFYQIQAMINKFKNKEKIAAYFTSSNTGKTGLGWEDAGKFGANSNMEVTDDGMMFMSGGDDLDAGGQYWGEGIPTAHNGGIHYENKWNKDKHSLNTNYKAGALKVKIRKNTLDQTSFPDQILNTNTDATTENDMFRQKIDATYNVKLDTTSNLKIVIDGTLKNAQSDVITKSQRKKNEVLSVYNSERNTSNDSKQQLFNLSAFYTKKLKKIGRNYSVSLSQAYNKNNSTGYLFADNELFDDDGLFDRHEVTDQFRDNDVVTNRLSSNITYNEPITKFFNLLLNYGLTYTTNNADRRTYDNNGVGVYDQLNLDYSNDFESDQLVNQVGAIFNYKKGKTVINFGTKTSFINFDQKELLSNQSFQRNFINWLPQAMYQYKFSAQKSISINYSGTTTQPSVTQLQPIRTNDDPNNEFQGNDQLTPSYTNRISFRYNTYKIITNQNFYVSGGVNFTSNQIVNNNYIIGSRTIFKAVNLQDELPYNYYAYAGFNRKLKFLGDINGGLNLNFNGATQYNYANDILNKTKSLSLNPAVNLSKYDEKTNFYVSFGPSYNSQESSLASSSNKGWGYTGYMDGSIKLPKKISLSANGEYTYQPSSDAFDNSFDRFVINASITKAFFKQESLKFMLSANDLLKQNVGFRRFASSNSITQTSYNNISRYFMFSLIWDFNKMGGGTPKAN
ncbi:outer membrane beta-barrel family protein [Pedobacter xixiisoli]|uniref:Carboxypeptidase regulatory-like domain-containing protein n=1 Tax=Pedobacter xixiisoli TaxID=1476464 RepID=A0A286AEH1_9SPHI|nr:outer membrane beta-barrel family protein [Pedobacter xixiisoli]SOD20298.1 Carboxypeptidase regulatory-like domain-containing protein [Pedobacter xixiisoli]